MKRIILAIQKRFQDDEPVLVYIVLMVLIFGVSAYVDFYGTLRTILILVVLAILFGFIFDGLLKGWDLLVDWAKRKSD